MILGKIGMQVPAATRLAVVEVDEDHPLLWTEQMMPVLPVSACATWTARSTSQSPWRTRAGTRP